MGAYVDDLATLYEYDDEHSLYHTFTAALQSRWNVEDEGELSNLLGNEFSRAEQFITLRQATYIVKTRVGIFRIWCTKHHPV